MPKILFDTTGMFKGKRLRALDAHTRYLYPYLMMLTDLYGRIELDEDAICEEFLSFKDETLTPSKMKQAFDSLEANQLCFIYEARRSRWAQLDTPLDMRREYPSGDDNRSPAPPEPDYTTWLKSIHDGDWEKFHLGQHKSHISEVRAAAGRASGEARRTKSNKQEQNERVVVGVVGDVAGEVEVEVDVATQHCSDSTPENKQAINLQGSKETATKDPLQLVARFRAMLDTNPNFNAAKLPKRWESLWAQDFTALLEQYEPTIVQALMEMSQSPAQAKYNITAQGLRKNADLLLKLTKTTGVTHKYNKLVGKGKSRCLTCKGEFPNADIEAHVAQCKPGEFDIEDELA